MRLMELAISPLSDHQDPKKMAKELAIWCYLSTLDANHVINTLLATGSAVIPIIPRNSIFEQLSPIAISCGFELRWYNSENKFKK